MTEDRPALYDLLSSGEGAMCGVTGYTYLDEMIAEFKDMVAMIEKDFGEAFDGSQQLKYSLKFEARLSENRHTLPE
jgi:hypothetical protein